MHSSYKPISTHIYILYLCLVDNEDQAIAVSEPDKLEDFSDYDGRELKSYPLDKEEALVEDDFDDEEEDFGVEDTSTRQLRGGCGSGRTRFRGRCVR